MKRVHVIQLAAALAAISVFVLLLTFARLRFSGSHATNLLGVLQEQEAEDDFQGDGSGNRNAADTNNQPMFCCPERGSGMACQHFDSSDEKCGITDPQSGEFADGREFQLTEDGLAGCTSYCQGTEAP